MKEDQNIEWKESWRDEYLKWICGFANAQGGKIYIGVNDAGEVTGLTNAKKLLEDIPNKITQALGIAADVNLLHQNGKDYLEIDVPAYSASISYKGIYHYRSGSTKQILTGPALENFLNGKRGVSWDHMPLPAFTIDDVDDAAISKFKEYAARKGRIDPVLLEEPKAVLLEKLHLTAGNYLTNAAMMLFAKDPEKWQLGAYVKIGYFETDADLLYQDEVHGALIEIVDKIVELIYFKYMRARITYDGIQRIERYFVPEAALREAVLNALCHTQYSYGVPIQISVYSDKMYIANCGQLPDNWTIDNLLQKHASRPYNPNIANVFYLAGFIESWGRGIEKICGVCRMEDLPQPKYSINPGDIMVQFTAPEDYVLRGPKSVTENMTDRMTAGVTEGVTVGVTEGVTEGVTDPEFRILEELKTNPEYSYEELAEKLNISRKSVAKHIKNLKGKGKLERIGSSKNGSWRITVSPQRKSIIKSGGQSVEYAVADERIFYEPNKVIGEVKKVAYNISQKVVHDDSRNVAHSLSQNVAHEKREDSIRKLIGKNQKVTRKEIADFLGVSIKTVERTIKKMDDIVYIGSGNNGYWQIKMSEKV